ncbi:hypothetical protein BJV74DRAFT_861804 [Russula compacta]|nr:hypothetical protein BJV74DRAFT_861804 [Russula compacta]
MFTFATHSHLPGRTHLCVPAFACSWLRPSAPAHACAPLPSCTSLCHALPVPGCV